MEVTERQVAGVEPARAEHDSRVVRLLDAAPDVGELLAAEDLEQARQALVVPAMPFSAGPWRPPAQDGLLGFLVLEGFIVRRVRLGDTSSSELFGAGDILRPWNEDADGLVPVDWKLTALSEGRLAVLDGRFTAGLARFPQMIYTLAARSSQHAQRAAVLSAIGHMKRIEDRLVVFFAHIAGEWARVSSEGIALPLSMPHAQIAEFIGAERPSVTTSLGRLRDRGLVMRQPDRTWLLSHDIAEAAALAARRRDQHELARRLQEESRALGAKAARTATRSAALVEEGRRQAPLREG
jgi:CRP-like cAMP-binding protein